ncbi:MAG: hypothetical protein PUE95_03555, partial [Lachnospiraceae bacterium]|nr:hypothetical protein [Lachnospiraceae bacterium]
KLLETIAKFGFDICPFTFLPENVTLLELENRISQLKTLAEDRHIPIDGMVLRYDSLSYSKRCGRTGHHYKDGIAYKFEDDTYETVFRSIEWEPGRSGEIAPVAVFDRVEIDGCSVSRASLHNLSFIRDLELYSGCRILVSKRNMIIPHVEENLDRGYFRKNMIPKTCPCCGKPSRIYSRKNGRIQKGVWGRTYRSHGGTDDKSRKMGALSKTSGRFSPSICGICGFRLLCH